MDILQPEGRAIANVKRSFKAAAVKAGLKNLHPHDLRRTCGSRLVQAGVPIQAVSALLRHSDIRITDQVYAHLSPTTVRAAIEVLDGNRQEASVSRLGFTLADVASEDEAGSSISY